MEFSGFVVYFAEIFSFADSIRAIRCECADFAALIVGIVVFKTIIIKKKGK